MKKRGRAFKLAYAIYLVVLAVLVVCATLYVRSLLKKYEYTMPEAYVGRAVEELKGKVLAGTLWQDYFLPEATPGEWEKDLDIRKEYEEFFLDGQVEFAQKNGDYPEDELYYTVFSGGTTLAEIKLKAKGDAVTKLAILSMREWNVEYVKPLIEKTNYTLVVPRDFNVKVYDTLLSETDGNVLESGEVEYVIEGVYFAPGFDIKTANGEAVNYEIKEDKVIAQYYHYNLVLPNTVTVKVNGEKIEGISQSETMVLYQIQELSKPEVLLSDYYGNEFSYEGGANIPLTHKEIRCEEGYTVTVLGEEVPSEVVFLSENPEYEVLSEYVDSLPSLVLYNVAVLKNEVEVCVTDDAGQEILLLDEKTEYSFLLKDKFLPEVPTEVAEEVDVLSIAQKWSLFMSADVKLSEISPYLIKDSYQYEVARKYAIGTDITFISAHTLGNPPFTEETVDNFVWITDNSFSVDVSFTKNMILEVGSRRKDKMNDRFYFVKYDDTDDGKDNPKWKIAGMKEIVEDAE